MGFLLGIGTHHGPSRENVAYSSVVPEEEERVGFFTLGLIHPQLRLPRSISSTKLPAFSVDKALSNSLGYPKVESSMCLQPDLKPLGADMDQYHREPKPGMQILAWDVWNWTGVGTAMQLPSGKRQFQDISL